jgi:predicted YcjX-like family ATPase
MAKQKKFSNKFTTANQSSAQQVATSKKSIAKEIATTAPATQPKTAEIQRRAYEFYCERGGQHGLHEADWYRAESELLSK